MAEIFFQEAVRQVYSRRLGLSNENKVVATECLLEGIEPEVVLDLLQRRMNDGSWKIDRALKELKELEKERKLAKNISVPRTEADLVVA